VLHIVDGVAQDPLRLRLGEDFGPDRPVGVRGDDQKGTGQVTGLITAGNVDDLASPHQITQPVAHPGSDHDDVGLRLQQGPGLALGLPAAAGDHAPSAGQLERDGIAEGHDTTLGASRESGVPLLLRPREHVLSARHSRPAPQ
jgi:hypothetical protein